MQTGVEVILEVFALGPWCDTHVELVDCIVGPFLHTVTMDKS